ncbi:homeobox protein 5 [Drosophila montana]|uniref:homeobox protein 5 n=1 Tax=Drosophila montana TaxID=40370 RepID=UPI00313BAE10
MRQATRININNSGFRGCKWLVLLLLVAPHSTAAQYASSAYNGQFAGYNQQQAQAQQPLWSGYPDAPLTYTRTYPAAVQSVWSSAPIVVHDGANSLEQERQQQQRRYLPNHFDNNRDTYANVESDRRSRNWFNTNSNNNNNNINNVPATRAANHNYNNDHFYYTQPLLQPELEQRELLAVADSRRGEDQIVQIGGSRSLANNNYGYFEPAQPLGPRDFKTKYEKHYSDYLRKYPQRLLPFYSTFVDK